jgi:phage gpG-like protein
VSGSTASIGTNVFYGRYHQGGTRKMVARPFMGVNSQDLSELQRIAFAFIGTALRG